MEQWCANERLLRPVLSTLHSMRLGFDQWIESYPRTMGWIISVVALGVAIHYGMRLFAYS